jgi:hypothetical protein
MSSNLKKRISVISKAVEKGRSRKEGLEKGGSSRLDTIDLTQPDVVQILISRDGKTVWVNIDGVCRLRVCKIKKLLMEDNYGRTSYQAIH